MPKSFTKFLIIILSSLILGACSVPFGNSPKSALDIKSEPKSSVFIDGNHVGSTPYYKDDFKPGSYTVELKVEANPDQAWQTKVDLKPQLLTNITRNFATDEDTASHFILSLEPIRQADIAQLSIVTLPDSAVVRQGDQAVGYAPIELTTIEPGDHQINLTKPGYQSSSIPIKAITGNRVVIVAKLGKDRAAKTPTTPLPASENPQQATQSAQSSDSSPVQTNSSTGQLEPPFVTVSQTETGWLRVRSAPTGATADNEVARVDADKSYPLLDSTETGWHQIEYAPGKSGWVAARYVTVTR